MNWTKTKPTDEGWYWVNRPDEFVTVAELLDDPVTDSLCWEEGIQLANDPVDTFYAGPLDFPRYEP